MKKCPKCGEYKTKELFPINRSHIDGLGSECKRCKSEYNKSHYKKNKGYYIDKAEIRRGKIRASVKAEIDRIKTGPCMDCGRRFHPCAMDFDHVRGKKSFQISTKASEASLHTILEEIKKCDLVCACCHRVRTHNRRVRSSESGLCSPKANEGV